MSSSGAGHVATACTSTAGSGGARQSARSTRHSHVSTAAQHPANTQVGRHATPHHTCVLCQLVLALLHSFRMLCGFGGPPWRMLVMHAGDTAPVDCTLRRVHAGQEQQAAATEEDDKRYINLAAASPSHARTSMTDLYGSRAIWSDYSSGRGGSRAQAARAWRAAGGDRR